MNGTQDRETLEQRLRYTLHSLAGTVTEEQFATTTQPTTARKSHRRGRRIAVGLGVIAVPIVLAASAYLNEGPEYVKAIPPERVVMTGSVDGSRYLLVETDRTDECGHPVTGVELVEERKNLIGSEWNTSGYEYGEHTDTRTETGTGTATETDAATATDCGGPVNDTSRYLKNPALLADGGSVVGNSFVWVYAVHPDVDTVRITSGDYTKDLKVYEVDGAGYAPFEIPKNMLAYTSELLIDGRVVPGSRDAVKVPRQ